MSSASGINSMRVGVVGGGVLGRLIALKGEEIGWKVTLFDKGDETGSEACSYRPPAMLAPVSELDVSEPLIAALGKRSLPIWQKLAETAGDAVFFQRSGSLVVAHPHDRGEMTRFRSCLSSKGETDSFRSVGKDELKHLEPQLDSCFTEGVLVEDEGQVDSRKMLKALAALLRDRGVETRFNIEAPQLSAKRVVANDEKHDFDLVIDTRGYGAKDDLPDLRAVRGEIIRIHAPGITLNRPVRLLHPRYPIYVVPHADGEFVIGATSIESEDDSPVSVRSALELLSAAFALNAAFGEARITGMDVGLRPAFPDNLPRLIDDNGVLRVNGLYRHGYLISPMMAQLACDYINDGKVDPAFASLVRKV